MTLHGIVRHLTNVERSWVRDVFAGHAGLHFDWTEADPDGELHVPADVTMANLLAEYAAETQRCDAVVAAAASLDVVSAQRASACGGCCCTWSKRPPRHLGHVDLLREQADGRAGEEPST